MVSRGFLLDMGVGLKQQTGKEVRTGRFVGCRDVGRGRWRGGSLQQGFCCRAGDETWRRGGMVKTFSS